MVNERPAKAVVGVVLAALLGCASSRDALAPVEEAELSESAPTEAADDAGPALEPASTADAGADAAAQPCLTSFEKNVLPALDAAGCASTQCHGTRFGPAIRIEVKDAALSYEELTKLTLAGKPYVSVGNRDPQASAIQCHLAGKCGKKMPPLGGKVPPSLAATVERWLACGAPKN